LIVVAAIALFVVIVLRTSRANIWPTSPSGTGKKRPCARPALPSLFKLIHGIVRETDSPRSSRAQHMKKYE
jgi:hypothetical protein